MQFLGVTLGLAGFALTILLIVLAIMLVGAVRRQAAAQEAALATLQDISRHLDRLADTRDR